MTTEETDFDSPVTETLLNKLGANINSAIDKIASNLALINTNASDITTIENNVRAGDLMDSVQTATSGSSWVTIQSASNTLRAVSFGLVETTGTPVDVSFNEGAGLFVFRGQIARINGSGNNGVSIGTIYEFRISGNNFQIRQTAAGGGATTHVETQGLLWRDF